MIYLEEHKHSDIKCPYCGKLGNLTFFGDFEKDFIVRCDFCNQKFKARKETSYFIAKDCELDGEKHTF
jgi:uncharacterized Zn-finger protein